MLEVLALIRPALVLIKKIPKRLDPARLPGRSRGMTR
jgi:hypothetical protein